MLSKFKTKILNHWLFSLVLTTIICFILDLVGYSCFNLYLKNVEEVNAFCSKYWITSIFYIGYLLFNNFVLFMLATLFDKKCIKYSVIFTILEIIENTIVANIGMNFLKLPLDILLFIGILLFPEGRAVENSSYRFLSYRKGHWHILQEPALALAAT